MYIARLNHCHSKIGMINDIRMTFPCKSVQVMYIIIISSPEPLGSQGELIGWP